VVVPVVPVLLVVLPPVEVLEVGPEVVALLAVLIPVEVLAAGPEVVGLPGRSCHSPIEMLQNPRMQVVGQLRTRAALPLVEVQLVVPPVVVVAVVPEAMFVLVRLLVQSFQFLKQGLGPRKQVVKLSQTVFYLLLSPAATEVTLILEVEVPLPMASFHFPKEAVLRPNEQGVKL